MTTRMLYDIIARLGCGCEGPGIAGERKSSGSRINVWILTSRDVPNANGVFAGVW